MGLALQAVLRPGVILSGSQPIAAEDPMHKSSETMLLRLNSPQGQEGPLTVLRGSGSASN